MLMINVHGVVNLIEAIYNKLDYLSVGLNLEQVDTLWRCVALDEECSDDCLNWFLNQAKSKDHHALCLETFKHIFLGKVQTFNVSLLMTAFRTACIGQHFVY